MEDLKVSFIKACGEEDRLPLSDIPIRVVKMGEDKNYIINGGCEDCPFSKVKVFKDDEGPDRLIEEGASFAHGDPDLEKVITAYQAITKPICSKETCKSAKDNLTDGNEKTVVEAVHDLLGEAGDQGLRAVPQTVYDAREAAELILDRAAISKQESWDGNSGYESDRILSARSEIGDAIIALAEDRVNNSTRLFSVVDVDLATEIDDIKKEVELTKPEVPQQPALF